MKINTQKLKLAMARKFMDAKDLAAAIECSTESIQQILSGRRSAPLKKLGKIAKALEVDPAELID